MSGAIPNIGWIGDRATRSLTVEEAVDQPRDEADYEEPDSRPDSDGFDRRTCAAVTTHWCHGHSCCASNGDRTYDPANQCPAFAVIFLYDGDSGRIACGIGLWSLNPDGLWDHRVRSLCG